MAIFKRQKITGGMQDVNTGVDAQGNPTDVLVDSEAFSYDGDIAPNESISSDWIEIGNFKSLNYNIQSPGTGSISALEYSEDGMTVSATGLPRAYEGNNSLLQIFLNLKSKFFRITYTNTSNDTVRVYFQCKLSTTVFQNTMASVFQPVTRTNVASIVKNIQEADNGSGVYGQVYRTGNSLNVNVTNPSASTDVSSLATEETLQETLAKLTEAVNKLTNGAQTTQIVDGNNLNRGVDERPFKVQYPAGYNLPITFPTTQPISGNVGISGTPTVNANVTFPTTQPVSASSLPLPTGASTSSLQTTGNTSLSNIDTDLGALTDPIVLDASQNASVISLLKGILQKNIAPATSATPQDITLVANTQQTIPANPLRKGLIVSSSNGTILIGIGFTATATRWSYRIVTNGSFDIPEHWAPLSVSLISTTAATATATLIV